MIVLGIETSCDETAAAVVNSERDILSNIVLSQIEEHSPYGGVVPEIAARAHVELVDTVIARAMSEAGLNFDDLDGVAVTGGPGLIGGVIVGVMTAKAIALSGSLPFAAVNHLEAHALTVRLSGDRDGKSLKFPYLLLLVSGGHCQLLIVEDVGSYTQIGMTLDDALGEAFDKTARMLGLGYPGGPQVELWARDGDHDRFILPRPMLGRQGCDFSFSGLKTKVRQTIEGFPSGAICKTDVADLCASFQQAAGDVLVDRCANGIRLFREEYPYSGALVVAGGVAANEHLRSRLMSLAESFKFPFYAPPAHLCTDNAAMVAWAGIEQLRHRGPDTLDFKPRPRWPLGRVIAQTPN